MVDEAELVRTYDGVTPHAVLSVCVPCVLDYADTDSELVVQTAPSAPATERPPEDLSPLCEGRFKLWREARLSQEVSVLLLKSLLVCTYVVSFGNDSCRRCELGRYSSTLPWSADVVSPAGSVLYGGAVYPDINRGRAIEGCCAVESGGADQFSACGCT